MRFSALLLLLSVLFSGCTSTPISSTPQQPEPEKKASALERQRANISKILSNNVSIQGNTIKAEISNNVLFDFDKYTVKKRFKPTLKKLASYLKSKPSISIIIEGHTDKTGKAKYNKKLSLKRANAVKNTLISFGIQGNKIATVGKGESNPISKTNNKKNRRVEIIFRGLEKIKTVSDNSAKQTSDSSSNNYANLVQIRAGFDKGNQTSGKVINTVPWYPIGGTDYLQKDISIIVAGISKDGKNHTVAVEVTLEVDRHTRYVSCIVGFNCSPSEDKTDTYTKTVYIDTKPSTVTVKKSIIDNVRLSEYREGYVWVQGKKVTAKDSRLTYKVLRVN